MVNAIHVQLPDSANGAAEPIHGSSPSRVVSVCEDGDLRSRLADLRSTAVEVSHPGRDPRWLMILEAAFGHRPYLLEVGDAEGDSGAQLPLCFVHSRLFGRFLVSLPYVNSGGCDEVADELREPLIHRAAELSGELDCRYLELRHERACPHPALNREMTSKVHMRLALPETGEQLWNQLKPKVRNQIRKGEKQEFNVHWGRAELLPDFYAVFSRNMRDLGTPVFGRVLFASILEWFGPAAEFCVVRDGQRPIAGALLIHGRDVTEVPSASSLRQYNKSNVNMLMYWELLQRAIERRQAVFDFGRGTIDGPTFRFKKQWGARSSPAVWQYHVLRGEVGDVRRESGKYALLIRAWKKLPLPVANLLGPQIVRGIP